MAHGKHGRSDTYRPQQERQQQRSPSRRRSNDTSHQFDPYQTDQGVSSRGRATCNNDSERPSTPRGPRGMHSDIMQKRRHSRSPEGTPAKRLRLSDAHQENGRAHHPSVISVNGPSIASTLPLRASPSQVTTEITPSTARDPRLANRSQRSASEQSSVTIDQINNITVERHTLTTSQHVVGDMLEEIFRTMQDASTQRLKAEHCSKVREHEEWDSKLFVNSTMQSERLRRAKDAETKQIAIATKADEIFRTRTCNLDARLVDLVQHMCSDYLDRQADSMIQKHMKPLRNEFRNELKKQSDDAKARQEMDRKARDNMMEQIHRLEGQLSPHKIGINDLERWSTEFEIMSERRQNNFNKAITSLQESLQDKIDPKIAALEKQVTDNATRAKASAEQIEHIDTNTISLSKLSLTIKQAGLDAIQERLAEIGAKTQTLDAQLELSTAKHAELEKRAKDAKQECLHQVSLLHEAAHNLEKAGSSPAQILDKVNGLSSALNSLAAEAKDQLVNEVQTAYQSVQDEMLAIKNQLNTEVTNRYEVFQTQLNGIEDRLKRQIAQAPTHQLEDAKDSSDRLLVDSENVASGFMTITPPDTDTASKTVFIDIHQTLEDMKVIQESTTQACRSLTARMENLSSVTLAEEVYARLQQIHPQMNHMLVQNNIHLLIHNQKSLEKQMSVVTMDVNNLRADRVGLISRPGSLGPQVPSRSLSTMNDHHHPQHIPGNAWGASPVPRNSTNLGHTTQLPQGQGQVQRPLGHVQPSSSSLNTTYSAVYQSPAHEGHRNESDPDQTGRPR